MHAPPPTHLIELADRRVLAVDDVGDPDGTAVVFLHGTPDTRRARHPDDGLAAEAGVRLLAIDRPGFGSSSPDAIGTYASFGDDVRQVLDHLAITTVRLLAWSAGAPWALGIARALGPRVDRTAIAAGTVPFEAYEDPAVWAAAGDARRGMVEAARELGAAEAAAFMAPMLVPDPADLALAREHLAGHDATTRAELAAVPGGLERMAEAMVDSVAQGPAGLVHDVTLAYQPSGLDLRALASPVALRYGELDRTCPPAFGHWYATRLPRAELLVIPGAGHAHVLTAWAEVLSDLAG